MTVYNVDEHLVIEIPDIIDRPLLMSYEDIEYEMDLDFGMSSGAMGKVREMMEPFTGENMDKIITMFSIFSSNMQTSPCSKKANRSLLKASQRSLISIPWS